MIIFNFENIFSKHVQKKLNFKFKVTNRNKIFFMCEMFKIITLDDFQKKWTNVFFIKYSFIIKSMIFQNYNKIRLNQYFY